MTDLDQLYGELDEALRRERGPRAMLRGLSSTRAVAMVVGLAVLVVLAGLAKPRADLSIYPGWRLAVELLALVVAALLGVVAVLRPLHRPLLPAARVVGTAVVGLVAAGVVALLPPAHLDHPASLAGVGDDLVRRALACLAFGVATGFPVGGLIQAMRRTPGVSPLAWVAGALTGMAALVLHCPIVHQTHLVAGHLTVVLLMGAVAVAAAGLARRRGRGTPSSVTDP